MSNESRTDDQIPKQQTFTIPADAVTTNYTVQWELIKSLDDIPRTRNCIKVNTVFRIWEFSPLTVDEGDSFGWWDGWITLNKKPIIKWDSIIGIDWDSRFINIR